MRRSSRLQQQQQHESPFELTADGAEAAALEAYDAAMRELLAALDVDGEAAPSAEDVAQARAEFAASAREIGALCDGRSEAECEQLARAAERDARRSEQDASVWEQVLAQVQDCVVAMPPPAAEADAASAAASSARPLPTSETYPSFLTEAETEYLLRAATAPAAGGGVAAGETLAMRMDHIADMLREIGRFQRAAEQQQLLLLRAEYRAQEASMPDIDDARALLRGIAKNAP
jgi:hypothetical protein